MCLKKILGWFKPNPTPVPQPDPTPEPNPVEGKKTALLFAINDYPGTANDLNGCLNDQIDLEKKLNSDFPGFVITKFKDSKVTTRTFIDKITEAISLLNEGDILLIHYSGHGTYTYDKNGDEADGYDEAVYLYDGMVIDDDIGSALSNIPEGSTVLLLFDSCFSGTVTREINKRGRFVAPPKGLPKPTFKRRRFLKENKNWIVFSGCGEHQTSADAYINGRYNGAFTYFALKSLQPGMTYKDWFNTIRTYLPGNGYEQAPEIEGPEVLLNKKVFKA